MLNPGKARERLSMEFFAPCRRRGFDRTVEQAYRNLETSDRERIARIETR